MSDTNNGKIVWIDLTVPNADRLRDFYSEVVGWQPQPVDMGDYSDYGMLSGDEAVAGVCYARGPNANMPPVWMVYIQVESVAQCVEQCVALGGDVLDGPRMMGDSNFAVIRDPAGAICGLIEAA